MSLVEKHWGVMKFPERKGKKAFVLSGAFYSSVVTLMVKAGYERANSVEEADVVVFVGGSDIDPALYGHEKLPCTYVAPTRDAYEKEVYHKALKAGKAMFGICRGAQFLAAMNGATLWQDVNNHAGNDHQIYDVVNDMFVQATSIHHQMIRLCDGMDVIAVAKDQVATRFRAADLSIDLSDTHPVEIEVEAACFKDTKGFFVQGHPEIGSVPYQTWTMTQLDEFLIDIGYYEDDLTAATRAEVVNK